MNTPPSFDDLLEAGRQSQIPEHRCVVRLSTSYWKDGRGCHMKRSLLILRRNCRGDGCGFLTEDIDCVGAAESMQRITNLMTAPDGIYLLNICNERRDWETGLIDDYDFILTHQHQ